MAGHAHTQPSWTSIPDSSVHLLCVSQALTLGTISDSSKSPHIQSSQPPHKLRQVGGHARHGDDDHLAQCWIREESRASESGCASIPW